MGLRPEPLIFEVREAEGCFQGDVVVVWSVGAFKYVLYVHPLLGEDGSNLTFAYFSNGLVQAPTCMNGLYIGVITYNPLILTFDPNFRGYPSTWRLIPGRNVSA